MVAHLSLTGNGFKLDKDLVFPVAAAVAMSNAALTTVLAPVFVEE